MIKQFILSSKYISKSMISFGKLLTIALSISQYHILTSFIVKPANKQLLLKSKRIYSTTIAKTNSKSYILEDVISTIKNNHPYNNIPDSIVEKIGRNLHLQPFHPLNIIKQRIEDFCNNYALSNGNYQFKIYDNLNPIVNTKSCFDDLRVGKEHVSRRPSDTYYLTNDELLRTHTSAHQIQFISEGNQAFLCSGDVYRRDEIDSSHYPVFHQMEGVRIFKDSDFPAGVVSISDKKRFIEEDLKNILTKLAKHLFGEVDMRWREDYFPFTEPSFELDVYFNEDWLEVLGCGVIHDDVMANAGKSSELGWAFGVGLERLAMVLFKIPDIRLFWTADERFLKQFIPKDGKLTDLSSVRFVPYSKYPLCYKDVSFWLPDTKIKQTNKDGVEEEVCSVHVNDIYEIIRNIAGDLVEKVDLFDEFVNKKTGKKSQAYRVTYRHMDRSLTNEEVDKIQEEIRSKLVDKLGVTLR